MQVERLFGIVFTLLDQKRVTASQLAERFRVSVRTIYRDIDTLSLAGIPVYTLKGKNGGISLLENFVMDKSLLTEREQSELLSVLQGTAAVQTGEAAELLSKMRGMFDKEPESWIEIDYSDWSGMQADMFAHLKTAIFQRRIITFDYYNSTGEKCSRSVEPDKLYFKHQAWYLKAFCFKRQAYRMFKLVRMKNLMITDKMFQPHDINDQAIAPEATAEKILEDIELTLWISPSRSFRVYDEFREDQIQCQQDGSYLVYVRYPPGEWVYSFILSFGEHMEVVSPDWMRKEIQGHLEKNLALYKQDEAEA